MAVSTFPVWIILAVVGFIVLTIVAQNNYHLSRMDKLRARCLADKPAEQRNNNILTLKHYVDDERYARMAFALYAIVSVCFCLENREMIVGGKSMFLNILIVVVVWCILAIMVTCFITALMDTFQKNAVRDLKDYYQRHYGVTVVNVSREDEIAYREYSEL